MTFTPSDIKCKDAWCLARQAGDYTIGMAVIDISLSAGKIRISPAKIAITPICEECGRFLFLKPEEIAELQKFFASALILGFDPNNLTADPS